MEKFIFSALLFFWGLQPNVAQDSYGDFGKINIGVIVPNELKGFSDANLDRLHTKLLSVVSKYSVSAGNPETGVVMFPIIDIYDDVVINAGLQNMNVVKAEFTVFLKQIDDKIVFGSITNKIQGSGRTKEQAINNLLSNIPTNSPEYKKFVESSKDKILSYYNSKCGTIISKAEQLSKANQHSQAIAMLFNIPEEVECFEKVKSKSLEIYGNYQNYICGQWLLKGKGLLSANNYEQGFDMLSRIDPTSKCAAEANTLFEKHGKEVDENVKRYWDFWENIYTKSIEADKYRWKAMSEMAVLYLTNNNRNVDYLTIINK
jgi:hypothetical protein